jgi:hypothetical protein
MPGHLAVRKCSAEASYACWLTMSFCSALALLPVLLLVLVAVPLVLVVASAVVSLVVLALLLATSVVVLTTLPAIARPKP